MKLLRYFFIILGCSLATASSIAQPVAFRADLNRMMSRQFMDNQMQLSMMRLNQYYGNLETNVKYNFKVTMKDSSKQEVSSKIYLDTTLHKNYLILENKKLAKSDSLRKRRIYPGQTLNISRDVVGGFYNTRSAITGMANDSCWLFKVISGSSINVYSFLSVGEGGDFEPVTVAAIQQNNGPIVKVNPKSLEAMITGDDDAVKALINKNYLKAIKIYNKHYLKAKKSAAAAGK